MTLDIPALEANNERDYLDEQTATWSFDGAYVGIEPYPVFPAAVLLTMRRAGETRVTLTMTRHSGRKVAHTVTISIREATPEAWALGDAQLRATDSEQGFEPRPAPAACRADVDVTFPSVGACGSCHGDKASISVAPITELTATYSDEILVQLFARGVVPAGYAVQSPFLRNISEATLSCAFSEFHAWRLPEELEQGLLFKLRSLPQ